MNRNKKDKLQATYSERVNTKTRRDVDRLMNDGAKQYETGVSEIKGAGKMLVAGCRKIWQAGRKFAEAEDINQLEFHNWHGTTEGWKQDYQRKMKVELAKKVYRSMEKEPSKLEDCRAIIQPALIAAGELEQPKRSGTQTLHDPPNLWTQIVSTISSFESSLTSITEETPMEKWGAEELEKFVRITKPVADQYQLAQELLTSIGK